MKWTIRRFTLGLDGIGGELGYTWALEEYWFI